ncbi:hypothetical protein ACOACO_00615 [Nocardioides sp. CPCC 205120]|uniref:hypothetical protein n=1 Tax=Nocardioides sp. CPCC 205120 TaxID=3406462 RepID=UPI003B501A8C
MRTSLLTEAPPAAAPALTVVPAPSATPSADLTMSVRNGALAITTARTRAVLLLAAHVDSGNGAYLSMEVRPGTTVVSPPLTIPGTLVELVDAVSGASLGEVTLERRPAPLAR